MEEVAPQAVSTAAMRTPAEVFRSEAKGESKAETELTRWVGVGFFVLLHRDEMP